MRSLFICLLTLFCINTYAQSSTHASDSVRFKPDCLPGSPLYVLDNKVFPCDSVAYLKPMEITEIQVFKGDSAKAYGAIGEKNGVIIITTNAYAILQQKKEEQPEKIKKP